MLIVLIIFWVLCGITTSAINVEKGNGGFFGFLLGCLLGPAAVIIAIISSSHEETERQKVLEGEISYLYKKCPHCAEPIRKEAKRCRYCTSNLH